MKKTHFPSKASDESAQQNDEVWSYKYNSLLPQINQLTRIHTSYLACSTLIAKDTRVRCCIDLDHFYSTGFRLAKQILKSYKTI